MTLPNDICRCHNASCDTRYQCARWLLRTSGSESTPHAQSLWDEDQICYAFLDIEKHKPIHNLNGSIMG